MFLFSTFCCDRTTKCGSSITLSSYGHLKSSPIQWPVLALVRHPSRFPDALSREARTVSGACRRSLRSLELLLVAPAPRPLPPTNRNRLPAHRQGVLPAYSWLHRPLRISNPMSSTIKVDLDFAELRAFCAFAKRTSTDSQTRAAWKAGLRVVNDAAAFASRIDRQLRRRDLKVSLSDEQAIEIHEGLYAALNLLALSSSSSVEGTESERTRTGSCDRNRLSTYFYRTL
uniref:DUF1778 domain-containing protein n=1 Tax=Panagrellus redivivus TaxID=6233 RepID=A0A7E4V7J4_PANRE